MIVGEVAKLYAHQERIKGRAEAEVVMDLMKVPTDEKECELFYETLEKYNALKK